MPQSMSVLPHPGSYGMSRVLRNADHPPWQLGRAGGAALAEARVRAHYYDRLVPAADR
jgi:hypothetical protein